MRGKKLSITARYVLVFGILLFLTSGILGFVTLNQSKSAMRELIDKNRGFGSLCDKGLA